MPPKVSVLEEHMLAIRSQGQRATGPGTTMSVVEGVVGDIGTKLGE